MTSFVYSTPSCPVSLVLNPDDLWWNKSCNSFQAYSSTGYTAVEGRSCERKLQVFVRFGTLWYTGRKTDPSKIWSSSRFGFLAALGLWSLSHSFLMIGCPMTNRQISGRVVFFSDFKTSGRDLGLWKGEFWNSCSRDERLSREVRLFIWQGASRFSNGKQELWIRNRMHFYL